MEPKELEPGSGRLRAMPNVVEALAGSGDRVVYGAVLDTVREVLARTSGGS